MNAIEISIAPIQGAPGDASQREGERRQRRREQAQHQKHVDIADLLLNACAGPAERGLRRAAALACNVIVPLAMKLPASAIWDFG